MNCTSTVILQTGSIKLKNTEFSKFRLHIPDFSTPMQFLHKWLSQRFWRRRNAESKLNAVKRLWSLHEKRTKDLMSCIYKTIRLSLPSCFRVSSSDGDSPRLPPESANIIAHVNNVLPLSNMTIVLMRGTDHWPQHDT